MPLSCGTQKLWITSALVSSTRTSWPVGMWISLAVSTSCPGYRTSHQNCLPSTSMTAAASAASRVLPVSRSTSTESAMIPMMISAGTTAPRNPTTR